LQFQAYDNIKKAKKAAADDKIERMKTGGGSYNPKVDSVEDQRYWLSWVIVHSHSLISSTERSKWRIIERHSKYIQSEL